jgi:L-galactono-1,4-lactone dehydrogenase
MRSHQQLLLPLLPRSDIAYMQELLRNTEAAEVPAHSPIEQRWTASSSSPMSPAAAGPGSQRQLPADTVHSWVGIIMYLPTEDPQQRQAITDRCGCEFIVIVRYLLLFTAG